MNTTAVIFFSRLANEEAKHKNTFGKSGYLFFENLIQSSINELYKTKFDVHLSFSNNQIGENFGEKITNEISKFFSIGYQNVIVVGNDCIQLNKQDIILANELLQKNKGILLGPNFRGGAYLIGVSKESFNYQKFIQLKWQSNSLMASFKNYAIQYNLSIKYLKVKKDINYQKDFWQIINQFKSSNNLKKLIRLFQIKLNYSTKIIFNYSLKANFQLYTFRAPPFLVFNL